MQVIRQEGIIYFDVDSTLIMHVDPTRLHPTKRLEIKDPIKEGMITVAKNEPMVRLLEEEYHRGSFIVVHSRGGYAWAENVITALGFQEWDKLLIMSKPLAYFDDKPVEEWLPYRVYIKPDEIYKNKG